MLYKRREARPTFAPKLALDLVQGQLESGSSKSWPSNGFNRATKLVVPFSSTIYLIDCSIPTPLNIDSQYFVFNESVSKSNRLFRRILSKKKKTHFFRRNCDTKLKEKFYDWRYIYSRYNKKSQSHGVAMHGSWSINSVRER